MKQDLTQTQTQIQTEELNDDLSFDLSKPHISRNQIQSIIVMKPINLEYYRKALVHSSMQKIIKNRLDKGIKVCNYLMDTNERLEFLGDAIFNAVITNIIYKKYTDKDEGFLTRIRTKIVRSSHCVLFAKNISLDKYILTSNKILGITDKRMINDRVLEDAFEAFIGAIYLDLGFKYAEMFIVDLVNKYVNFQEILKDDNYKDILMRFTQAYGYELPVYLEVRNDRDRILEDKRFTMSIQLKKNINFETINACVDATNAMNAILGEVGIGSGNSKKEAEQRAAKYLLDLLETNYKNLFQTQKFLCRDE
jgi:ribonuclease-3